MLSFKIAFQEYVFFSGNETKSTTNFNTFKCVVVHFHYKK
jgi:hypothetical protein